MRITLCWVDDEHAQGTDGVPAFGLPGVAATPLRARTIVYQGTPVFGALMADPQLADIAARVAAGHWRPAIFGKPARPGTPVHDGDRIELLGPITADPKAARHARVRRERARSRARGQPGEDDRND